MNNVVNIDLYRWSKIVLCIRCASIKFFIRQYYLNVLYLAYMDCNNDSKAFIKRYQLFYSLSPSSGPVILSQLINKYKLIEKIETDVYIFTPLSCEILSYIDEQLTQK